MRDRQEKQAYLALVSRHIAQLTEQCTDLTDQANTLKARKQDVGHINELLFATLSASIALKSAHSRLALELNMLSG
jgi:cell division septum initiation protein DivIVA